MNKHKIKQNLIASTTTKKIKSDIHSIDNCFKGQNPQRHVIGAKSLSSNTVPSLT
jgi:hypothetical protein